MCFGKIFLAIAWIVSFEATCSVCCDYNPGCFGWTSQANCPNHCVWTGSACRDPVCSDISGTQLDCENEGCIYDVSSLTCRAATSCSDFPQPLCDYMSVNGKQCAWIGTVCKVPSCADFQSSGQAFCEGSHVGFYEYCKYNTATSTCTLSTSCSDWNGNSDCDYKSFSSDQCSTLGSVCKVLACEDFASTQTVCESSHMGISGNCKFNTATSTCTLATSCSNWTSSGQSTCESKYDSSSGNFCIFDTTNNVCRLPICEDKSSYNCIPYQGCAWASSCTTASSCSAWDGQSSDCSSGRIGDVECTWQNSDSTCIPAPSCASLTSQTDCDNYYYCSFVDVCPQEAPPSHAIFMRVSSLLVVLLLAFLL